MSADPATPDRRICTQLSEDGPAAGRPAPVVLAVALSVPADSEDDLAAWYTQEHIAMLLEVPGWRRIRSYRLVRGMGGPGPDFLSAHELAGPEVLEEPPFAFVQVQGDAELPEDRAALLRTATAIAARYIGAERAEEFGRRAGVPGELVVRAVAGQGGRRLRHAG